MVDEVKQDSLRMQVMTCYSCGQRHDDVALNAYEKPPEPWTHWYSCPANRDPVPMSIEMCKGGPVERCRRVVSDLAKAVAAEHWLATIFFVNDQGGVTIMWNAQDFPHAHYETCVRMLSEESAKHGGLPAPTAPLPRAQKFDLSKMFNPNGAPEQSP